MHEALPPRSKGERDGDIATIALNSRRSCWSLQKITAPLKHQLNKKVGKIIRAKVDVRNVEKFEIKQTTKHAVQPLGFFFPKASTGFIQYF